MMEDNRDSAPATTIDEAVGEESSGDERVEPSDFDVDDPRTDIESISISPEAQMTEEELRRLYEEGEIERFLGLFADVSVKGSGKAPSLNHVIRSLCQRSNVQPRTEKRLILVLKTYGKKRLM